MFDENYNSAIALKKIAKILLYFSYSLMVLFAVIAIASIVVLGKKLDDLFFVPIALLLGGTLLSLVGIVIAHLIHGFADLIEACKNTAAK